MKKKKYDSVDIFIAIFLGICGLLVLYPFYNTVVISLTTELAYNQTPFMLYPKEFTLNAYELVFRNQTIWKALGVTVFVLVLGVIYNMFLTTTIAYGLTKDIPGVKFISVAIIFTMYFQGGLIPYYVLVNKIGLNDSLLSMILPVGIQIVYMIVIKNYFLGIPKELEESAKIDGANDIVIFYKIMLPLALPILATFALYYSVERWNEWWNAMLFIRSVDKRPLQIILRGMIQEASRATSDSSLPIELQNVYAEGIKMATVVVTMAPVMILYPFLQKYFIRGLMDGAVKM